MALTDMNSSKEPRGKDGREGGRDERRKQNVKEKEKGGGGGREGDGADCDFVFLAIFLYFKISDSAHSTCVRMSCEVGGHRCRR